VGVRIACVFCHTFIGLRHVGSEKGVGRYALVVHFSVIGSLTQEKSLVCFYCNFVAVVNLLKEYHVASLFV
jgi:hypothetical protein